MNKLNLAQRERVVPPRRRASKFDICENATLGDLNPGHPGKLALVGRRCSDPSYFLMEFYGMCSFWNRDVVSQIDFKEAKSADKHIKIAIV